MTSATLAAQPAKLFKAFYADTSFWLAGMYEDDVLLDVNDQEQPDADVTALDDNDQVGIVVGDFLMPATDLPKGHALAGVEWAKSGDMRRIDLEVAFERWLRRQPQRVESGADVAKVVRAIGAEQEADGSEPAKVFKLFYADDSFWIQGMHEDDVLLRVNGVEQHDLDVDIGQLRDADLVEIMAGDLFVEEGKLPKGHVLAHVPRSGDYGLHQRIDLDQAFRHWLVKRREDSLAATGDSA